MRLVAAAAGALGVLLIYDGCTSMGTGRRKGWLAKLDLLAAESGMKSMTGPRLMGASALCGLSALIMVAGLTGSRIITLILAAAAAWSPFSVARARRQKRRNRFREAWPDAIATLIAGVRAGVSLPESCSALASRGPADLHRGWQLFESAYRATGSFRAGLERLQSELADPIADRVVAALALAQEVGGSDLVRVLRTLGDFVREDLKVRKEIEARWSWTVTAARVAGGAPWIVLLLMSTRPETAAAYNSRSGAVVVACGAAATVLG
nr:type II secretion system F family protein [Actinomycetota bacterium]